MTNTHTHLRKNKKYAIRLALLGPHTSSASCIGRRIFFFFKAIVTTWEAHGTGDSHGQRSLAGYRTWGCKELDTTERTHVWGLQDPLNKPYCLAPLPTILPRKEFPSPQDNFFSWKSAFPTLPVPVLVSSATQLDHLRFSSVDLILTDDRLIS